MDAALIKPNLLVQAKGTSSITGLQGITVGSVDHIDGPFVKLNSSENTGRFLWIPLEYVDYADDRAIYLKLSPSEFQTVRLDSQPFHDH